MNTKWRRFEMLIPLHGNDGTEFPEETLGEAVFEVLDHFRGVSFENATVVGHWFHEEKLHRDLLSRLTVDVPDTIKNRRWMKAFKGRWKARLKQLEIWMVSFRIEVE